GCAGPKDVSPNCPPRNRPTENESSSGIVSKSSFQAKTDLTNRSGSNPAAAPPRRTLYPGLLPCPDYRSARASATPSPHSSASAVTSPGGPRPRPARDGPPTTTPRRSSRPSKALTARAVPAQGQTIIYLPWPVPKVAKSPGRGPGNKEKRTRSPGW